MSKYSDLSLGEYDFRDFFHTFWKGEWKTRQELIDSIIFLASLCGVELALDYTNFGKALVGDPTYPEYFGNINKPEKFLWVITILMSGNVLNRYPRSVLPTLSDLEYLVQRLPIYIASERGKKYLLTASQVIMRRLGIPWNTPDFIRIARGEIFFQMYPERVTEKIEPVSTGNLKRPTSTPKSRVEKLKTTLVEMEQAPKK